MGKGLTCGSETNLGWTPFDLVHQIITISKRLSIFLWFSPQIFENFGFLAAQSLAGSKIIEELDRAMFSYAQKQLKYQNCARNWQKSRKNLENWTNFLTKFWTKNWESKLIFSNTKILQKYHKNPSIPDKIKIKKFQLENPPLQPPQPLNSTI
jgi:hypothetical protein